MKEKSCPRTDEFVRAVTRDLLERRVDPFDGAVGRGDHDAHRRMTQRRGQKAISLDFFFFLGHVA